MMKKFNVIYLSVLCAALTFAGCNDDGGPDDIATTVKMSAVHDITASGAVADVVVSGSYSEAGICYATTTAPTTASTKIEASESNGFACAMTGLKAETKYYVRPYAVNAGETVYGSEASFTTGEFDTPTFTSVLANNITFASADVRTTVVVSGECSFVERGFCYTTGANPTVDGQKIAVAGTTGVMKATLAGLQANKTYTVKSYAIYGNDKVAYSSETTFSTSLPVALNPVSEVFAHRAMASITIHSNGSGGNAWTEAGVCWSTSTNPTVADDKKAIAATTITQREYTDIMIRTLAPGTKYYVRAYVKNATDVLYSPDEQEITTRESVFDNVIVFSNARPGGWGDNKYNYADYSSTSPYNVKTVFQDKMYAAFKSAIYTWTGTPSAAGRTLNTLHFGFHFDDQGNKVFNFNPYYMGATTGLFNAFFIFDIDINSTSKLVTVSNMVMAKQSATSSNSQTMYNALTTGGVVGALTAYFDYLTAAPFTIDWYYARPEAGEDGEGGLDKFVLMSTTAQDDEYFVLQGYINDATTPIRP